MAVRRSAWPFCPFSMGRWSMSQWLVGLSVVNLWSFVLQPVWAEPAAPSVEFRNEFPADWQYLNGARVESLTANDSVKPVAWLQPRGEVVTSLLNDGFRLAFAIETGTRRGGFALEIERCRGESLAGCAWEPLHSVSVDAAHPYEAGTPLAVMLDTLGPYRLRWRLSNYTAGKAGISDVVIEPLDTERRQRLVEEREMERILGVAEQRVQRAVISELKSESRKQIEVELLALTRGLEHHMETVADAQGRLSFLAVVVELERAMNEVNSMTNPARYTEFRKAMELVKQRFSEHPELFDGISADIANVETASAATESSYDLKRYAGEVLRFVADVYAPDAVTQMVGGMFSSDKEEKLEAEGRQLYMRLNAFMTILVSEKERIEGANQRLRSARESIRQLNTETRHLTIRMLELLGDEESLSETYVNQLLGGDKGARQRYGLALAKLRGEVLAGASEGSVDANRHAMLLEHARVVNAGMNALEEGYMEVAKSIDDYFVGVALELELMQNPFQRGNTDDANTWLSSRTRATEALKSTRQCFNEAGLMSFTQPYSGARSCLKAG